MIHPTAIIHPNAQLHPTVEVGPYSVIDEFVEIGAGCVIGPHVHITGHTVLGEKNQISTGCVIGGGPQDLKYYGEPTRLRIGNGNIFREMFTINCSNNLEEDTTVGDENFFMINSHVGHNCHIGNHVILANGALIAGHCVIDDRVFVSGNVAIHQFVHIGELVIVSGVSAMSADIPPYVLAIDKNTMEGLNIVGLRRAGMPSEERLELRKTYKILFRSGLKRSEAIQLAESQSLYAPSRKMIEFVKNAKRPVTADLTVMRRAGTV